jgi:hypothetical protein
MPYTEDQIRTEALRELANSPNGRLTTSQLIELLELRLHPQGNDAEILDGRSDTYFSQKVRNLVSHRDQGTGLQTRGLATYDPNTEGWDITVTGRQAVAP